MGLDPNKVPQAPAYLKIGSMLQSQRAADIAKYGNMAPDNYLQSWNKGATSELAAHLANNSPANLGYLTGQGRTANMANAFNERKALLERKAGIEGYYAKILGPKWQQKLMLAQQGEDLAGIQMQGAEADAANRAALWGGLLKLGTSVAGAAASARKPSVNDGNAGGGYTGADDYTARLDVGPSDFDTQYLDSQPNQLIPYANNFQMKWP